MLTQQLGRLIRSLPVGVSIRWHARQALWHQTQVRRHRSRMQSAAARGERLLTDLPVPDVVTEEPAPVEGTPAEDTTPEGAPPTT